MDKNVNDRPNVLILMSDQHRANLSEHIFIITGDRVMNYMITVKIPASM